MITTRVLFFGNTSINLVYVKKDKYFVLNHSHFLKVPNFIKIIKMCGQYFFSFVKEVESAANRFIIQFNNWAKIQNVSIIKKLVLKGLGLKAKIYTQSNSKILELKLGFSHLINIVIPNGIQVKVNKTLIFISAKNKVLLGNFLYSIHRLKAPNAYKGKGVWYKNEIKVLKIIKKV